MPPLPDRAISLLHNNNGGGDLALEKTAIHGGTSTAAAAAAAAAGSQMKRRSVSMLEMADLEDLKEFSNAMDQLEWEHHHHRGGEGEKDVDSNIKGMGGFLGGANNGRAGGGDNDDFLFFDAEIDNKDNNGADGDHLVTLVAKAAFKEHDNHNPHALLKSGGGGGGSSCNSGSGTSMRRIQSMGVTTSTDGGGPIRRLSLLGMAPDLRNLTKIDEDEDDSDHEKVCDRVELLENRGGEETIVMVNFGDKDDDDDIEEEDLDRMSFKRQDRPQKDLDISASSRLSSLRNSIQLNSSKLDESISASGHALSSSRHSMQPKKSSMKKSTSQSSMKRNVSFSSLEIRSYNITVGDAPTPNGVPLSLDWEYDPSSTETYDVNDYESTRSGSRREKHEMYVPNQYRVYLLMRDAGVSRREIKKAIEESRSSFKRRQQTIKNLKMQPVEEALEKTKRKFAKLTGRVRK